MRRVARAVDAGAMTLYTYLPDGKASLEDAVAGRVLEGLRLGEAPPGEPWRDGLRRLMLAYRDALLRHPRAAPLVATRPVSTPDALRLVDRACAVLLGAGCRPEAVQGAVSILATFVIGGVLAEAGAASGDGRQAEPPAIDAAEIPALAAVLASGGGAAPSDGFADGLDTVLDGIERRLGLPAA